MKQIVVFSRVWMLLILFLLSACAQRPEKTIENFKNILINKQNVVVRYLAFAKQAEKEGFRNVSNFFEAIAYSEEIHVEYVQNILRQYGETVEVVIDSIEQVGLTLDNLSISSQVQVYKAKTLLPRYIEEAEMDELKDVTYFLRWVKDVSVHNSELCDWVLVQLASDNTGWTVVNSWSVCSVCGYLYKTAGLSKCCRLCDESASAFILFQ